MSINFDMKISSNDSSLPHYQDGCFAKFGTHKWC
jgi:hypothetical protein